MSEENKPIVKKGRPRGIPRATSGDKQRNEQNQNITESNPDAMENNKEEFLNDVGSETPPDNTNTSSEQKTGGDNVINETTQNAAQSDTPSDTYSAPFSDPLISENVETKSYEQGLGGQHVPQGDIPEPIFKQPSLIVDDSPPKQTTTIPKSEIIPPLNEEVSNMSDAEKKAGAEMTVAAFWSGYEKLNALMGNMLQIPVDRRLKMHTEGKLDLRMEVQVTVGGDRVTVDEFFEQYNTDVKNAFVVDQKLKDDLDAPMKREAMKRGLVMSDMQTIMYRLGEDIVTKTVQLISIKMAVKNFEKAVTEEYSKYKMEIQLSEERRRQESRMIDPDSEAGMEWFQKRYNEIRSSEIMSEQEKARAKSELFKEEKPDTKRKKDDKDEEYTEAVVISDSSDLDVSKEL
jgi:hypothetical protein